MQDRTLNRRILYVIHSLVVGGAEMHLLRIARALKSRGWAPEVFVLESGGSLEAEFEKAGIPVYGLLGKRLQRSTLGRKIRHLLNIIYLMWIMYRTKPAISHFFLTAAYLFGTIAGISTNTGPRIMSRRSLNYYQDKRPFLKWLERKFHNRTDRISGNSLAVMEQLKEEGVPQDRLTLIYNGIEVVDAPSVDVRETVRTSLGLREDDVVLILVANLIPYKGHADLVQAVTVVKEQLTEKRVRILCVGRDTGILESLRNLAESLDVAENFLWLGARSDVPQLLQAADVGLLVSHEEGFSNALLEAMGSGLPMVVTRVGGNAEAVVDEETGLVVPAHDPKTLGQALVRIIDDPILGQTMGQAGRARLLANFTLDACVDQYETLYEQVMRDT